MRGVVDAVRAEEDRRDREGARIRDAIADRYAVGGDVRYCVRQREIREYVRDALDLRQVLPDVAKLIDEVITGMGAVKVKVGHARVFNAVRRHSESLEAAARASSELRRQLSGSTGKAGRAGKAGKATETDWEAILAAEGMPAELPAIKRGGSLEHMGGHMSKRDGVYRQGDGAARAGILSGEADHVTSALADLDADRRVLQLRGDGLSIRQIARRMGIDRNKVDRALRRLLRPGHVEGETSGAVTEAGPTGAA